MVKAQYDDNIAWIRKAQENKLVVGSQARILYSDQNGRVAIALAFNEAIADKIIKVSERKNSKSKSYTFRTMQVSESLLRVCYLAVIKLISGSVCIACSSLLISGVLHVFKCCMLVETFYPQRQVNYDANI